MFAEGSAAIPISGMGAIPEQMNQKLKRTKILFNTEVKALSDKKITLVDNRVLEGDFIVITSNLSKLVQGLQDRPKSWKSCHCLYFEIADKIISKPLIGLIPDKGTLINNIFYSSSLKTTSKGKKNLLSVTVIDDKSLSSERLIEEVKSELQTYCGIEAGRLVKLYTIPKALPELDELQYDLSSLSSRVGNNLFLAGDAMLNGSLNAAMLSGERAAADVIEAWSNN